MVSVETLQIFLICGIVFTVVSAAAMTVKTLFLILAWCVRILRTQGK